VIEDTRCGIETDAVEHCGFRVADPSRSTIRKGSWRISISGRTITVDQSAASFPSSFHAEPRFGRELTVSSDAGCSL
jgi:hypothetical protein